MEAEEDWDVFLLDLKPSEDVASPKQFLLDYCLEELLNRLNGGLGLLREDLGHIDVSALRIGGYLLARGHFHSGYFVENPLRKLGMLSLPQRSVVAVLSLDILGQGQDLVKVLVGGDVHLLASRPVTSRIERVIRELGTRGTLLVGQRSRRDHLVQQLLLGVAELNLVGHLQLEIVTFMVSGSVLDVAKDLGLLASRLLDRLCHANGSISKLGGLVSVGIEKSGQASGSLPILQGLYDATVVDVRSWIESGSLLGVPEKE